MQNLYPSLAITARPPLFQQRFQKWSLLGLLLEKFQPGFSSLIKVAQVWLAFSSIIYGFI
ncbi:hypothetical protein C7H83_07550 [Tetragenococcus halophilus]|uniref:Uncharacterized protein n=1 Tax=Tetragenococcus halophilus TaxID=51669 RepID=A0A3G5FJ03_TETHA|nr:hypothetical protein C7H83_07550 [Tetragenococcus halophilus]RQD32669.1 hypothetical protein C7K42_01585 [Tetragenococcus halophilus subsp. halophilus DSM 20339]